MFNHFKNLGLWSGRVLAFPAWAQDMTIDDTKGQASHQQDKVELRSSLRKILNSFDHTRNQSADIEAIMGRSFESRRDGLAKNDTIPQIKGFRNLEVCKPIY